MDEQLTPVPRPGELRFLIREILTHDSDLDAFCLDHFPVVYQHYTSGMDRVAKENLLLQTVSTNPTTLYNALNWSCPDQSNRLIVPSNKSFRKKRKQSAIWILWRKIWLRCKWMILGIGLFKIIKSIKAAATKPGVMIASVVATITTIAAISWLLIGLSPQILASGSSYNIEDSDPGNLFRSKPMPHTPLETPPVSPGGGQHGKKTQTKVLRFKKIGRLQMTPSITDSQYNDCVAVNKCEQNADKFGEGLALVELAKADSYCHWIGAHLTTWQDMKYLQSKTRRLFSNDWVSEGFRVRLNESGFLEKIDSHGKGYIRCIK